MGTVVLTTESEAAAPLGETSQKKTSFLVDNCWCQLAVGIVGMVAIANMQYGWTLFVEPMRTRFDWERTQIQWAFTLFVLAETWLVPIEGYLVDRFGPRIMVAAGGLFVGAGWLINSLAESLTGLYLGGVIGGAGAGIVYGTSVGNALKWFPRRRGLAAGLTAAAFGAGSALTVLPISNMIKSRGYSAAFLWFGLAQGVIVLVCSFLLRTPRDAGGEKAAGNAELSHDAGRSGRANPVVTPGDRSQTWLEMLQTPAFWLMYVLFTMVATGGLMATAQLGSMAKDYGVADVPVNLFGITMAALPLAMSLDRVLNGLTRPFFGWVSDHLGRENTMFVAFSLEGVAILLMLKFSHVPLLFVLLTGLTFFAWGEIYSLFPAMCGDLFGRKFATTNYGLLYTAKGTASLLVPLGSYLQGVTGGWQAVFLLAVAFDWIAALLALFVLKPMRKRMEGG
ncbi:MAG: oxalate/formate MFS antiporter [Planctomycetia bacterium]|nr:oxalate/formate MFS antiporter [Planctomycetia bacterium]